MKLDLHTHCFEMSRFSSPDVKTVGSVVNKVKQQGLDGIAVTEHDDKGIAYEVAKIVEQVFAKEILIIPGREVRRGSRHVVELYLQGGPVFRFLAHPAQLSSLRAEDLDGIHGVEIENGLWHIDREMVDAVAREYRLLKLSNSDAHTLVDIGKHYNDINLDELYIKAAK
jgi:PHP family Zn ribbon phosphoesterase